MSLSGSLLLYVVSVLILGCAVLSPLLVGGSSVRVIALADARYRYQINGRSSIQSGVDILPLMLSFVIGTVTIFFARVFTVLFLFQY